MEFPTWAYRHIPVVVVKSLLRIAARIGSSLGATADSGRTILSRVPRWFDRRPRSGMHRRQRQSESHDARSWKLKPADIHFSSVPKKKKKAIVGKQPRHLLLCHGWAHQPASQPASLERSPVTGHMQASHTLNHAAEQ